MTNFTNMKGAAERGKQVTRHQPANAMAALEQFGAGGELRPGAATEVDFTGGNPRPGDDTVINGNGEVIEHPADKSQAEPEPSVGNLIGKAQKHPPKNAETFKLLVRQIIAGMRSLKDAEMLHTWWNSPNARSMRNGAQMTAADTNKMAAEIKTALGVLKEVPS